MKHLLFGQFLSVELMRTGIWSAQTGRVEIKRDRLARVVANYKLLRDEIDIPLKLGHAKADNLLPKGMAAAGWISNVRLQDDERGAILIADVETTSETITALIRNGAYKNVSVEINHAFEDGDGKIYQDVLTGLALLGAELPAVKGLKDIGDSYLDKKVAATDEAGENVTLYTDTLETEHMNELILQLLCLSAGATDEAISIALKPLGLKLGASDADIAKAAGEKMTNASGETKEERVAREKAEAEAKAAAAGETDEEKAAREAAEAKAKEGEGEGTAEMAALSASNSELTARLDARDKADATSAIKATVEEAVGVVLMPASRDTFIALGEKGGIEVLTAALKKLPKLTQFTTSGGKGDELEAGEDGLTEEDIAFAEGMGVTKEELINGAKLLAQND